MGRYGNGHSKIVGWLASSWRDFRRLLPGNLKLCYLTRSFAIRRLPRQALQSFRADLGITKEQRQQLISVGGNLMSFNLISSLAGEGDLSVVHAHALGRIGAIGLTVARKRRLPFVVSIHGGVLDLPEKINAGFRNPPSMGWEWGKVFGFMLRSRSLFEEADAIVTGNPREAEMWRKKFSRKQILVQPHGVPAEMFEKDHRKTACDSFPRLETASCCCASDALIPLRTRLGWWNRLLTSFEFIPRRCWCLREPALTKGMGNL